MANNYNSTLQSNNTDLQAILNTINELPNAGGEQATPVISVNSANGLITATAGTKSATHQLAFQAAKTITPTTTSQIAVSSGYYTGGNIVIAAIPSTYIQPTGTKTVTTNGTHDVKSYASVNVNVTSSGGSTDAEDALVTRTITSYTNNRVKTIGSSAFYQCYNLTSVNFPAAATISEYAFADCSSLTSVNFPAATIIGNYAFQLCSSLTSVSFPVATIIGDYAFFQCPSLTSVDFPKVTSISLDAFANCYSLTSVNFPKVTSISNFAFLRCSKLSSIYLTNSSVCNLTNSNAFANTGIWSNKGSIYVPSSLVASYKTATNWAYFSSRFVGI